MRNKIGNVTLNYQFYNEDLHYSDGKIEDTMLQAAKDDSLEELLYSSKEWAVLYHCSDIRENLLEWYPFKEEGTILEIGSGCGALTGLLSKKAKKVTCVELSEKRSLINAYRHKECNNIEIIVGNFQEIEPHVGLYDYITLIGVWEYSGLYIQSENPYLEMLEIAKRHLRPDGKMIIAIENKMGLKYWNGAVEDHTGKMYSGLNDYAGVMSPNVRTFSKHEIEGLLQEADIDKHVFYYPMPDYKLPDVIYTEKMLPAPGMERNYGKDYSSPRMYNFNDAIITDQLCADNMFSYFANSFLVVTGEESEHIHYVKYNRYRKDEFRVKTEILTFEDNTVVAKSALSESAKQLIMNLNSNEERWQLSFPRIKCIGGESKNDVYIMPHISGVNLETLFYQYRNNADIFVQQFKYFIDTYFSVSEEDMAPFCASEEFIDVFGSCYPRNKKSLKCTNVDLNFSNFKLTSSNELYCFDNEWVFDFLIPFEYVIWRSAMGMYEKYRAYLKYSMSLNQFVERIGIGQDDSRIYAKMESKFMEFVLGEHEGVYLRDYRKPIITQDIRIM